MYTYQGCVTCVCVFINKVTCAEPMLTSSFKLKSLADIASMKHIGILSLALGMATDVVIAFALCFFLRGLRTGHHK